MWGTRNLRFASGLALAAIVTGCGSRKPGEESAKAPPNPQATIAATIASGPDTRFAAAVRGAGLERALGEPGPWTVLVPDNGAFDRLPAGATEGLLKPGARHDLGSVVRFHVLRGLLTQAALKEGIRAGGGRAVLATADGQSVTAMLVDDRIVLTDGAGTRAVMAAGEQVGRNGVVLHIGRVLMPEGGSAPNKPD